MFNFEKLDTWQKAIDFADRVYTLPKTFPADERFGLTAQMRRAAVSVSSNIAEGSSRKSRADYARFVEIATGSVFEVVSQAFISKKQGYLNAERSPSFMRTPKSWAAWPAVSESIWERRRCNLSTINHQL